MDWAQKLAMGFIIVVIPIYFGVGIYFANRNNPNDTAHGRLAAVEASLLRADQQISWLLRNQCRCPRNTGSTGEIGAK